MSINKVTLLGHLGADAELKFMPSGEAVANLRLATTQKWTDKVTNEKKEQTEWHRLVCFRRLAEIAGQYCKKGKQIYVEGRLQTRKWTDEQGVERYSTEIVINELQLLGGRPEGAAESQGSEPSEQRSAPAPRPQPERQAATPPVQPQPPAHQQAPNPDGWSGFGSEIPF